MSARGDAGLGVSVVFLAACWMDTLLFPIHYGEQVNRGSPGPDLLWGLLLLLLPLNIPEEEIR